MSFNGVGMGYGASLSYIAEDTAGSIPGTPTWIEIGRITDATITIGSEKVQVFGLDSQTRNFSPQGNENYEISIDFHINDVAWTFIQLIADGNTYTVRLEQAVSGTTYYAYLVGCVLDEVSVSGDIGDSWRASATIKCQKVDSDTVDTSAESGETEYTKSSDVPDMCHGGVLSSGANWSTGSTADLVEVTTVEFSLASNHIDNYVLNQNYVEGFYSGNKEASFSFTCNFINAEQFTRILSNESGELKLEIVDGGNTITFSGCDYDELSWNATDAGEKSTIEVSGMADSWSFS